MPTAQVPVASDRSLTNIAGLFTAAMIIFMVAPRTSPGVLGLLTLSVVIAGGLAAGAAAAVSGLVPRLMLLLSAWALISVAWAADRGEAINKSLLLALLVVVAAWSMSAIRHLAADALRRSGEAALVAFVLGVAYLFFEEVTDHGIKRTVFTALPFALPPIKHISDSPDGVVVSDYISNRNMAAMVLVVWPMLLVAGLRLAGPRRLPALTLLLALAAATLAMSKHETSVLALALSVLVFALCFVVPRLGIAVVAAGWLAATLLVVPLANWAAHGARLYEASWLPNSARHRIVLWAYTAEQVWQRPVIGVGAASTKRLDHLRGPKVATLPGTRYEWRSGTHAHSVYLQTWYELGAIGAVLLCAAGLALLALIARLPATVLPTAAATFTSAAVIAAFSWGMWQAWFLAMFAVAAVLSGLAAQLVMRTAADRAGDGLSLAPAPSS
jgi:O-antigen ligase